MAILEAFFFFQNVVAYDPIKILTHYAPQNDRRNLSFVKDINVVGNKLARNTPKMTISKSCIFFNRTDFISTTRVSL